MKARQVVMAVLFLIVGWGAACYATLDTITAPEGTVVEGWSYLTIPALPYDPAPEQVFAGGPLDGTLYRWDAASQSQFMYDEYQPDLFGGITSADGYELDADDDYSISFSGFDYPADTDAWISLPAAGYSLMGIPFDSAVEWDNVWITDGETSLPMSDEDSYDFITPVLYGWDAPTQSQFDLGPTWAWPNETETRPWMGYWATTFEDNLALIVPANGELPSASSSTEISDAKLLPDSGETEIAIEDCYITYASADSFYVEQDNRMSGIRVYAPCHGLDVGYIVTVYGKMATDQSSGERYVDDVGGIDSQETEDTPGPLGMNNRALGGGDWHYDSQTGAGQQGVTDGHGLNNIGLLVRTWGKVVSIAEDGQSFVIDDGTGAPIKCVLPDGQEMGVTLDWRYFQVTGVVSCYEDDGDILPQILLNSASDLKILHVAAPPADYTASVAVDASETVGAVGDMVFGTNVEWYRMSRALLDNPLSAEPNVVSSVTDAIADLDLKVLRYFGGDWDHWRWGVGPADHRPQLMSSEVTSFPWYVPYFGTDEFMRFCEQVGCYDSETGEHKAMLVVNALQTEDNRTNKGWGDMGMAEAEAANWVEYCNGVVDQDLLDTADEDNWEPSRFILPADSASNNPPIFSSYSGDNYNVYRVPGADGHKDYDPTNWYAAIEWANGTTCWLCTADDAPAGYFTWLRRYFAWQRAGSPTQNGEETWKDLDLFTEASYHAPYNVKYWEIGNEVYSHYEGSSISDYNECTSPAEAADVYSSDFLQFDSAMKVKDSSILTGINVIAPDYDYPTFSGWSSVVIPGCSGVADFASSHNGNTLGSLVMETLLDQNAASERNVWFPEAGEYIFRVTARVESAQSKSLEIELKDGAQFVDSAGLVITTAPGVFQTPASPDPGPLNVPNAGMYTVSLRNPNQTWTASVYLYRVTAEGPSMPETSIWYPDDVEQQLLSNDSSEASPRHEHSRFHFTLAHNLADLKDLCDDLPLFITEGSFYSTEGKADEGYNPPEVTHSLRFKSAFWEATFLKTLSDLSIPMQCQFCLADPDSGLVPLPVPGQSPSGVLRPTYHFLKLVKDLAAADRVEAMMGSDTPTFTDLSTYPEAQRIADRNDWPYGLPKPENIKCLDITAYKTDTKLYLLAVNWKNGEATTAIDLGSTSVSATAAVKTLKVTDFQSRSYVTGNANTLLEAFNETKQPNGDPVTPDGIEIVESSIQDAGSQFTYTFQPTSITLIELTLSQ